MSASPKLYVYTQETSFQFLVSHAVGAGLRPATDAVPKGGKAERLPPSGMLQRQFSGYASVLQVINITTAIVILKKARNRL